MLRFLYFLDILSIIPARLFKQVSVTYRQFCAPASRNLHRIVREPRWLDAYQLCWRCCRASWWQHWHRTWRAPKWQMQARRHQWRVQCQQPKQILHWMRTYPRGTHLLRIKHLWQSHWPSSSLGLDCSSWRKAKTLVGKAPSAWYAALLPSCGSTRPCLRSSEHCFNESQTDSWAKTSSRAVGPRQSKHTVHCIWLTV